MKPIEALNKLNELAFSFYTAGSFAAASNLEIFDHLGDKWQSAEHISEKLNIHPEGCRRLLSAMVNLDLVEHSNQTYRNSTLGNYLTKGSEVPMGFSQKDSYFYHMWQFLPDALRENSPRHEQAWNKTAQELYQAIYSNDTQLRSFFRLLDSYNIPIGQETAELLNFSSYTRILDLAGGTGSFAAEVVKRNEHLSGVVLDLEPVQKLSKEMIAKNGLESRFEFVVGDMFKPNYPEADVIFLSYILHNWNDEKCIQIIKNCYESLPSKGMVVISEKVLNNDFTGDWWGVMMNLQMLIAFEPGSKERTENEYDSLLKQAGFVGVELIRLDAPRDLLIAYKP
ncbi:MAG: hypothetical protein COA99_03105 [Moraxellaceae bacterium]|nr:MAG: hypothetical protein COA99_03105 [Moraxellaceae bacterium]